MDRAARRRALATALAACLAGYGVYRLYRSDAARRALRALRAVWELIDALATTAELSARSLREITEFLDSDSDELPGCLRQACKALCTEDARAAVGSMAAAAVEGAAATCPQGRPGQGAVERLAESVLRAFVGERGRGLVSLAAGMAARNSVRAAWDCLRDGGERGAGDAEGWAILMGRLVRGIGSGEGERLVGLAVSAFASGLVSAYMDRMDGENVFDGLFEAMSRSPHRETLLLVAGVSSREAVSVIFREGVLGGAVRVQEPVFDSLDGEIGDEEIGDEGEAGPGPVSIPLRGLSGAPRAIAEAPRGPIGERGDFSEGSSRRGSSLSGAIVAATRTPEIRDLLSSMVGSAAREGTRAAIQSIPEALSRAVRWSGRGCRACSRDGEVPRQRMFVAMTVLMSVMLYASTSMPVI
ncbi:unnamed protein product [Ostreobium quekettii]|uniref:Protein PHLOEM PROTEIN 2-LIKE A10 n=1 Tax=Ostreobium quekettii TaxID=121088 RepID=A0A8S1JEP0_9CHLO|nr:unnamed protein product [Ostreobium quekettii]|eukprot:evm.model.scf_1214EXC.2 EVM.evm.TU.scf_1214EXC.2   scf_1214EXC:26162-27403(-)